MDEEIRLNIVTILDQHRIMTIATLRPDGWPQATTVGYANDGLTLYVGTTGSGVADDRSRHGFPAFFDAWEQARPSRAWMARGS